MPQFKFTKSFQTSVTQNTKKTCFRKKKFLHNKLFVRINSSYLSWATKVIASLWSKLIGSHLKSNFILSCLKLLLAEFPLICCSLFGSKIRNVQTFCCRLKSTHDDANEYVYEVRHVIMLNYMYERLQNGTPVYSLWCKTVIPLISGIFPYFEK